MLKFFRIPFATGGDKTAVPDAIDASGFVSYSEGYGFDYQRQVGDAARKVIERAKMNELFFDLTTAIAEIQSKGVPDFITAALNGGSAYSYAIHALVRWTDGEVYYSLAAANTADPTDVTKWAKLPTAALLQSVAATKSIATGTADALAAAFVPAITALPAAPGTLSVLVRAAAANATATPTFSPDGLTAKTIVKNNNQALVAGDIAGAGHWLHLQYDATLDKWVLLNPAVAANATNVYQDADPAAGTYRFLLGNGDDINSAVHNLTTLYFNTVTATIQGANISGSAAHLGVMTRSEPIRAKNTQYVNATAYSIYVSITVFLANASEVWLQIAPTAGTRLDEQSNFSGSGEKRTLSGFVLPGESYGLFEQVGTVTVVKWTETT